MSELPVLFTTKFRLVINLKAANALGLDVSEQLQFLADKITEVKFSMGLPVRR